MKKIVAIGGSNSRSSINKTLATYAARQIDNSEVVVADLNDYALPLYGIDEEKDNGIPEDAHRFNELIASADGLVVSLAEHNGSYSTAFKNAFDWLSRIHQKVWKNKPMLLMATSPGARGGATVLQTAKTSFPHLGGNIVADFSLPSFHNNFSEEGIADKELNTDLHNKIRLLQEAI
ncbi:NADPH-dependent FMN reductase [Leptobacterium flavescens]|uniref:NADPH-dependent FMN reductase n=1 Tax=Leptobacterium flavescens TaxID=472055 RepID=A0A6P0UNN0_9FLAO|nr:NAD(P)H-dependent oxidoreductase [Leptobacterium flavescens]NER13459.1 NADPH-dependent FMN reductase [Leptobacterium flavescens]